jgi:hypothetical protein
MMSDRSNDQRDGNRHAPDERSGRESGFEKRGGNISPATPTSSLPQVPAGPAPGATATEPSPAESGGDADE